MGRERRVKLFGAFVALALFALAGAFVYGAFSGNAPSVDHRITVDNHGDNPQWVNLTLRAGSETVFTDARTVSSGGEWNATTRDAPGEYALIVETRAGSARENYTLPYAEDGRTSFAAVSVTDNGAPETDLYQQQDG